ncbi:MAG: hypothetical protein RXR01_09505 [Thermoproteus sp.]
MYFSKVRDPVMQIAITAYNAVTAFVMVFHFLEFMAGLAVKIAVTLLAFSVLAVIFGPTRALGGALLFFALIMIVPSYIGYYLAPLGMEFSRKTPTQPKHSTKKLTQKQRYAPRTVAPNLLGAYVARGEP